MGTRAGNLSWHEFRASYPKEARVIEEYISGCSLEPDETIDKFTFENKVGIIKVRGPNDVRDGVPPLWYLPIGGGYCTGDPNEDECNTINQAGFQYNWMDYLAFPDLDEDLDEEDTSEAVDLN